MQPEEYTPTIQESFFRPFFKRLGDTGALYAVLHSYETLPYHAEGDVDIAVHGIDSDTIEGVLCTLCEELGWSITQRLWYDIPLCLYYVLQTEDPAYGCVKLDFMFDPQGLGYTCFPTSFLTDNPVETALVYHTNPSVEFCYKLIKRIRKGYFRETDPTTLMSLFNNADIVTVETALTRQLGSHAARDLIDVFRSSADPTTIVSQSGKLSGIQKRRCRFQSLRKLIARGYWRVARVAHRVTFPCGLVVYIPDNNEDLRACFSRNLPLRVRDTFRYVVIKRRPTWFDRFYALSASTLLVVPSAPSDHILIYDKHLGRPKSYLLPDCSPEGLHNATSCISAVTALVRHHMLTRTLRRICRN